MRGSTWWVAPTGALMALWLGLMSHASAMPMREAVGLAVATNPEIGEAIANREAIEFELRQGRGLYLPRIDIEGRAGALLRDSPSTRRLGDDDEVFGERSVGVVMRQLLFDGFATRSEVEHQAARVDAASLRVFERSELIGLAVIREYLDIVRLRQVVDITRDNVAYHDQMSERIELGTVGGSLSVADRQQAEERLYGARAQATEAVEEVKAAEARFIRLVGKAVGKVSDPPGAGRALPSGLNQAIILARRNNPSLASAQADVDAAYGLVKVAESRFYPKLSLEARARAGQDLDGVPGEDRELRAGVVLDWNLYNGGIDAANRQEQIRRVDEATMAMHRIAREVEESVRLAWDRRQQQAERLQSLRRQLSAADDLVKSYSDQFAIGQRSLIDLLDAQSARMNARITVQTAQAAVKLAEFRILAATGTLLDSLGVAPPAQAQPYARTQAQVPPTPPPEALDRRPPPSGLGPLY